MEKKFSDEKAIELILGSLQKLKRGEISFEGFAVGVALVIDPVPLTEKDFEWAREKAVSLGLESLLTSRAADALECGHPLGNFIKVGNWLRCGVCGQAVRR